MKTFDRYFAAVRFLDGLSNIPSKNNFEKSSENPEIYLKRMRYFLDIIGSPDRNMKYVHIGGTAGKGSVTAMMHEILHAAGKSVGSFNSPCVSTYIEQIKVGNEYISPDEFADLVEYLKPYLAEACVKSPFGMPSYFEIFLAVALLYFQRKKCEWVVLEVGLGGRYDATNVIESPTVTAITNIDYDHTEILGKTLKKIALDKGGIIKSGASFFTSEQQPALLKLFKKICDANEVPLHQVSAQKTYGEYNEALATMIARHLEISEHHIKQGIGRIRLPCRFEVVQSAPIIILDGAHNRAKIMSTIKNFEKLHYNKLHLITGVADNKNTAHILDELLPRAQRVYVTRFQTKSRMCADPKKLFTLSKKRVGDVVVEVHVDPNDAVKSALRQAQKNDLILITGSFYLAGELRKHWYAEEKVLRTRSSF